MDEQNDADADGIVVEDDDDDLEEIEIEPEKLPTPVKPPSGRPQTAPRGGRKTAAAATSPKKNAVAVGTPPPPEEDVPLDWDRALPRFMPSPTPSSPTPPSPTRENVLVSPGRLRPLRTSASAKKAAAAAARSSNLFAASCLGFRARNRRARRRCSPRVTRAGSNAAGR
jgi:hypothetical protein